MNWYICLPLLYALNGLNRLDSIELNHISLTVSNRKRVETDFLTYFDAKQMCNAN
jgi:hypothetical protein